MMQIIEERQTDNGYERNSSIAISDIWNADNYNFMSVLSGIFVRILIMNKFKSHETVGLIDFKVLRMMRGL